MEHLSAISPEPAAGDLSADEERVWSLLDRLRPLLELLDGEDADDDELGDAHRLRIEAMLKVFTAGLARAAERSGRAPRIAPAGIAPDGRMELSEEEQRALAFVPHALDRNPEGHDLPNDDAGLDPEALRRAIDGFHEAAVIDRLRRAVDALTAAFHAAERRRAERKSARITPPRCDR